MTQITRLYDMDWSSLSHEEHWENIRVKVTGKWAGTKKGAPGTLYPRGSGWKEAATYSPALHCSTIGASGLNFSVRNGKRWDPTAITTWCLVFSSQVCSWQVDKLFVSFAAVITSSNLFTCLLVNCSVDTLTCWLVDKLFVLFVAFVLSSNSFTRLPSTC